MVYSDAYCNLKTKQTLLYGAVKQEEGNHLHGDMAILLQVDAPMHRFSRIYLYIPTSHLIYYSLLVSSLDNPKEPSMHIHIYILSKRTKEKKKYI